MCLNMGLDIPHYLPIVACLACYLLIFALYNIFPYGIIADAIIRYAIVSHTIII